MEPLVYLREYALFLDWFKCSHPRLYVNYFANIMVPRDGKGVTIIRDHLKDDMYKRLVNIRNDYYRQKSNDFAFI